MILFLVACEVFPKAIESAHDVTNPYEAFALVGVCACIAYVFGKALS